MIVRIVRRINVLYYYLNTFLAEAYLTVGNSTFYFCCNENDSIAFLD